MDGYLRLRRRFMLACAYLGVVAVVVATALIVFAWAANPPEPPEEDPEPGAAVLMLGRSGPC